ncbi:MAG: CHAT domain-containing protein [Candidatus Eisenbacteria sp.]|nr:CHAT domain-containing protein [Candidatus Eisenbacteria bacterium]
MTSRAESAAQHPEAADFWTTADPTALEEALGSLGQAPGAKLASTMRDRAAAHLLTDPSLSLRIAMALHRAVRRHDATVSAEVRAVGWRCRAEASLFTGRLKAAREAYARATAEAEAAKDGGLLGQILVGRIHVLSLLGEAGQAERWGQRAERLLRRSGDAAYLGKLFMNRGNAYYQQDRYGEAYNTYRKAADVFSQAGLQDATWVGLLMNQAIACTNLARLREARDLFLKTEAHCDHLALESLGAHARFNRAFLEALAGDYRAALTLLEEAGATFEQQGQRDMVAAAQRSRAEIYLDLGMPAEAHDLAVTAAETFMGEGMALDGTLARVDQARSLLQTDRAREAIPILDETQGFFRRRKMQPRRAAVLLHLARAHAALGDLAAAATLARRALRSYESLHLPRGALESRRLLAEFLVARRRPAQAQQILAPAVASLRTLPVGERLDFWRVAGRVSLARRRRGEALRRLKRAAGLVEAQRRLIPGAEFRARAFARQVGVYRDLIALQLDSPRPRFAELFGLLEMARARGFRDRLFGSRAPIWEQISEKRAQLGSLTRRLEEAEFSSPESADRRTISELRRRTQGLEKELVERIRRAETSEAGVPEWGGATRPERIAALLSADEVLLEYYVAGDKILVMVLKREERAVRVLPVEASTLRQQIERVRFQLDAAALTAQHGLDNVAFRRSAAEAALRDLYDAVLRPLEGWLPKRGRLVLVPHAFLHRIPFECLHDGATYIHERWLITRAPTGDFLIRRELPASRGKRGVLICGMVRRGPAFVAAEIDSIASHFVPRSTKVLRDPTSEQVLDELSGPRIIHLSTHGTFREDNPLFSRLSTDDGAIFLADVLGVRLSADLVVLSACESGQVVTGYADELAGVAHAFLAAGARQLVASQWRIHDAATQAFMEAFYAAYTGSKRKSAARALVEAQRTIRERWDHPFYWAGFSIYGA